MNTKKSLLPLFLLPVIWGGYYVASQKLVGFTSAFASGVGIRFLTFLLLSALMLYRGEVRKIFQVKGVLGRLCLIGVFGFLLDFTAFLGLSLSSAASGTALLKCDVLMVNLMSIVIYKKRFSLRAWFFTLVMLLGVFLVMGLRLSDFRIADPGNIFFLLSAFFVSCNAFVIKSAQTDRDNPICDDVIAYYNNFITLVLFLCASLASGALGHLRILASNRGAMLALVLASLGQTLVYIVYYKNLRHFEVWMVKTFLLLMPVVSMLLTFVLFDERVGAAQLGGMAVIMLGALGILLDQRSMPKQEETEATLHGVSFQDTARIAKRKAKTGK